MAMMDTTLLCNNNEVPCGIVQLFTEFVKPCNVWLQFRHFLTKREYENVLAEIDKNGNIRGSHELLSILTQKTDWFALIVENLRHTDIKLQHIADLIEEEMRIFRCSGPPESSGSNHPKRTFVPPETGASLYIKYNNRMEEKIYEIFISFIEPQKILHVFHKYSNKVLTQNDMENVKAKLNHSGNQEAARMLLERLVLYENWLDVLREVLEDSEVNLRDFAMEMSELTSPIKEEYEKEKEKLQTTLAFKNSYEEMRPAQVVELSVDSAHMCNIRVETVTLLGASPSEKHESHSAEMKHGAGGLSQSGAITESNRHSLSQAESSVDKVENSRTIEFLYAAASGNEEHLTFLIESLPDINVFDKKGKSALVYAAGNGQVKCVELLICSKCDVDIVDDRGNTALMMAAGKGKDECLRLLVYARASIDLANKKGTTALMFAAEKGNVKCLSVLLEAGCDTDIRQMDGRTALMFAAKCGHNDCVKFLIDRFCDVNAIDEMGCTALIYAVQNRQFRCVELLLEGGADVDKSGKDGNSAILWAVVCQGIECVKLLIKFKADLSVTNSSGHTPLTAAEASGNKKCVKLIKRAMKVLQVSTPK